MVPGANKEGKTPRANPAREIEVLQNEILQLQARPKNAKLPAVTDFQAKRSLKEWRALKNKCLSDRGFSRIEANLPPKDQGAMRPNVPGWKPRAKKTPKNVLETGLNRTIFLRSR